MITRYRKPVVRSFAIALVVVLSVLFSTVAWAEMAETMDQAAEEEEAPSSQFQTARDVVLDERKEEPDRSEVEEEETAALMQAMRTALEAEEGEDYELARDEFVRAYQIYPHSNILLSVARVSASHGALETAVLGYQRFLERQEDYENREELERRIDEMEAQLAAEREAEEEQKPAFEVAEFMPSTIGWVGAGVAVVGMISMIGGGRSASRVDRDFETLEQAQQDGDRDEYSRLYDDISSRQTRGKVFLYGGMGLTAAGIGLLVVDYVVLNEPALFFDNDATAGRLELDMVPGEAVMMRWRMSF